MSDKTIIKLENLVFNYDGEPVLDGINLSIHDKEFVTFLGPSGCGKTTTLRIIGGFIYPHSGNVYFDGKLINELPPHKREVNTVFQRYALFPHLNVFDNVAFGLKLKKLDKREINKRVKEMLEIVNLKGFDKRKVNQLSGGQQQRVAIARALVNHPKVLLLDEPLGALDLKLRKEMQLELKKIQQRLEITFIYVTHDQEEALTMSDTVVVMKDGEIQQVGTPQDIYNEPTNAFVADFIGESNIIDGVMINDCLVSFNGHEFECVDTGFGENQPVDVVVRPEDIEIVAYEDSKLHGEVESVVFKGVHYEMTIDCEGLKWLVQSTDSAQIGSKVGLKFDPFDIHIMNKLFPYASNYLKGMVVDENTVEFLGIRFERQNLGLPVDTEVNLTISPKDIEVVSEDHSDKIVYLESMIYKGAYNEFIVYTEGEQLLFHSQNDEQVATDIGIKINFDNIVISLKEPEKEE
ncbi:MAG: ABC transporter ATP-binding protein [Clostridiales bacterium]|nr:ABC transporter ATP-binding protein [Clostridiales bacterium]